MNIEKTKRVIREWFGEFRPDLKLDNEFVEQIYQSVKEDIAQVDTQPAMLTNGKLTSK
ncbi:hypothetical protein [Capnocytophaga canimorsus]|uniref:hypothetical protein n=1 Tax=Capnocytophaga canimorsus TaxID=28188 RepID=UPI001EDE6D4D|nr:hypothetical protein [Capnocytophaga canimorsus]GJQ04868.1 hypothetical protein CAPN009_12830 [Capnocytophaga canimorsus]